MLYSGIYQTLKVNRISDFGLYLADEEGNEVLLPNRYVSLDNKIGDEIEVFVYHDSEDRLVATTQKPFATVGEIASLEVVDKTIHGAFMNWGLEAKDIFLPNRNMIGRVEPGKKYVVYIYRDNITGRAVATMSLKGIVSNETVALKRGEEVEILVALPALQGFRVVVNGKHWGMIYKNQLFSRVQIGDKLKAYVRYVTEDNRIDISLQQEGYDEVKKSAEKVIALIGENGGLLPLNDDSTPEDVRLVTGMSKKVFKRTVGYLLKRNEITMDDNGIKLSKA